MIPSPVITPETLQNLATKISDLETEMSRPEIATDPNKMRELLRDHKHSKHLHDLGAIYLETKQQAEEATTMSEDADLDDDMREMAQMEAAGV